MFQSLLSSIARIRIQIICCIGADHDFTAIFPIPHGIAKVRHVPMYQMNSEGKKIESIFISRPYLNNYKTL